MTGDLENRTYVSSTRADSGRAALKTVLSVALLFGLGWGGSQLAQTTWGDSASLQRQVSPRGELLPAEKSMVNLFRKASQSAVNITAYGVRHTWFSSDIVQEGNGTGIVWDDQGHIVTNFHVIYGGLELAADNAPVAKVTLADHTTWDATLVGFSRKNDLAVLKIKAPRSALKPVPLGTSEDLQVGQSVYAIGNPFGLDQTLTTGVVSALNREIMAPVRTATKIRGVIQTDAAINPGNSGGPLLDSAGRLVGVNTAIVSPSGTSAGIGFAIPVDRVFLVVPELIAHGRLQTPGLGVVITAAQGYFGVKGLYVTDLLPGGSAERAGLRAHKRGRRGDIIVSVAGTPVHSVKDLQGVLASRRVGERVQVEVLRQDKRLEFNVALQRLPE